MKSVHRDFPSLYAHYRRQVTVAAPESLNPDGHESHQSRASMDEGDSPTGHMDSAIQNSNPESL